MTVIRFSQVIESTAAREGPPGNGHAPAPQLSGR